MKLSELGMSSIQRQRCCSEDEKVQTEGFRVQCWRTISLLWTTIIIRAGMRTQATSCATSCATMVWISLQPELAPCLGLAYSGWQFGPLRGTQVEAFI